MPYKCKSRDQIIVCALSTTADHCFSPISNKTMHYRITGVVSYHHVVLLVLLIIEYSWHCRMHPGDAPCDT